MNINHMLRRARYMGTDMTKLVLSPITYIAKQQAQRKRAKRIAHMRTCARVISITVLVFAITALSMFWTATIVAAF